MHGPDDGHQPKRAKVEQPSPRSTHQINLPQLSTRLPPISQLSFSHGRSPLGQDSAQLPTPINHNSSSYSTSAPSLYQLAPIQSPLPVHHPTLSAVGTSSLDALASVASSVNFELAAADEQPKPQVDTRSTTQNHLNYWRSTPHPHPANINGKPRTFDLDSPQPLLTSNSPRHSSTANSPTAIAKATINYSSPHLHSQPSPYRSPSAPTPAHSVPPSHPTTPQPPPISLAHPAIQAGLAARQSSTSTTPDSRLKQAVSPTASLATRLPSPGPGGAPPAKVTLAAQAECRHCQAPIASLIFRGKYSQFEAGYDLAFACARCVPVPEEVDQAGGTGAAEVGGEEDEVTYPMSFSAALDRIQGVPVGPALRRKVPTKKTVGQKRRVEGQAPVLVCDVCWRDLGTGQVANRATGEAVEFGIEAICTSCCSRYQRCTDCGGGGGTRIGVGKWRSRLLFGEDRRSCNLSHIRLGSPDEMTYDVWAADEIDQVEFEQLIGMLKHLYLTSMISTLAIPDQLESALFASSYEEVNKLAEDTWTLLELSIREDVDRARQRGIRRYFGLRWSTPTPRKKAKRKLSSATATTSPEPNEDPTSPLLNGSVIRPGKTLASFIVCEMDETLGSAYLPLVVPTGTGDGYDSGTILMQGLLLRVQRDIEAHNAGVQAQGTGVPLLAPLSEVWSTHLHRREASFFSRLGERRGFMPLDDYLAKTPGADPTHFPPHRPIFMPNQFLRPWQIVARTWSPTDDMTLRIRRRPSKASTAASDS